MWWNDIRDIKEWMVTISSRLTGLEVNIDIFKQTLEDADDFNCFSARLEDMEEKIDKITEEFPRFEKLVNPDELVSIYEKQIIKIEKMLLEFKGCVSMARSAIAERKDQEKEFDDFKKTTKVAKDIYQAMSNFITAGNNIEKQKFFKLDAIYRKLCESEEKKSPKKNKPTKKKSVLVPCA
jgi:hypothetical protein